MGNTHHTVVIYFALGWQPQPILVASMKRQVSCGNESYCCLAHFTNKLALVLSPPIVVTPNLTHETPFGNEGVEPVH